MTLEKIITMSDVEILSYLEQTLKTFYNYKNVVTRGDLYIYAEGGSPHCLVAHIDTVRAPTKKPMKLEWNRGIVSNPNGILGADDRAGVYIILQMIQQADQAGIPLPRVLFTNYEESGAKGADAFCRDFKEMPGVNLFVEYDRKGCNEYVYYNDCPKEVKKYVESFGYQLNHGSFSDITVLCEEYLIPGVNLSCGYYGAHTSKEVLHTDELTLAISRGMRMLDDPIEQLYTIKPSRGYLYGRGWGDFLDYPKQSSVKKDKSVLELMKEEAPDPVTLDFNPLEVDMSDDLKDVLEYITYGDFSCDNCGLDVFSCGVDGCGNILNELDWQGTADHYNEYLDICDKIKYGELPEEKDFLYSSAR